MFTVSSGDCAMSHNSEFRWSELAVASQGWMPQSMNSFLNMPAIDTWIVARASENNGI